MNTDIGIKGYILFIGGIVAFYAIGGLIALGGYYLGESIAGFFGVEDWRGWIIIIPSILIPAGLYFGIVILMAWGLGGSR